MLGRHAWDKREQKSALAITLPGLDDAQKKLLVDTAHQVCPYSNATRGNIAVDITIV